MIRFLHHLSAARETAVDCLCPGGCARNDTRQQRHTHIRDFREICYQWHPWHGHRVWVHASLVKRGRAVARCSLEDVQPCRVLELPLWMLDVAACCKVRASKSGLANVQSLRALKEVLGSTSRARSECTGISASILARCRRCRCRFRRPSGEPINFRCLLVRNATRFGWICRRMLNRR